MNRLRSTTTKLRGATGVARLVSTLLVLGSVAHPAAPPGSALQGSDLPQLRRLTPTQMEEDLFALTEELATEHGGLYRYTTQEELDEAFGELLFEVSEERSVLEFHRLVSELVARVRCGHTSVNLGALDASAALGRRGLLPLEILLRGERAFVRRCLVNALDIDPGDEILSIDGVSLAEIQRVARGRMEGDGFIETGRERQLERDFARLYGLLVDAEASGPFRVEFAKGPRILELPGMSPQEFSTARSSRAPRPVMSLELDTDASLGVLAISTFGDPGGGDPSFPEQLEACFTRLAEARIQNLALDLRGNGGGQDMYGALVVSYLCREPFRYFERIEVTEGYSDEGETVHRDGRRLMLSHPGLGLQQPAPGRFAGRVFLLTDGWTFSTAADVATVVHHLGLATFVGEETGGGYDGNTSGMTRSFQLTHSGLSVNVPRWMYTTANLGHAYPGRGVPSDHHVPGTVAEALQGTDAQLEFVRRLLARERAGPAGALR